LFVFKKLLINALCGTIGKMSIQFVHVNNTPLNPLSPKGQARGETDCPLLGRGAGVGQIMLKNHVLDRLNLTAQHVLINDLYSRLYIKAGNGCMFFHGFILLTMKNKNIF